jgi:hypothetical protein
MRNCVGLIVVIGFLVLAPFFGAPIQAQEPPTDEPAAAPETAAEPQEDAAADEEEKESYFGLYVAIAGGAATIDDINSSIITRTIKDETSTAFKLEDQLYARASVGWKLQKKGDFRLDYKGYKEDTYAVESQGLSASILENQSGTLPVVWWDLTVENGQLNAQRTPRWWTLAFDKPGADGGPGNSKPDPDEVQYTDCSDPSSPFFEQCRTVTQSVPENLNNRLQTFDVLYGQEFGKRRVSSRWWAGFRYMKYTGQIMAPAWLMSETFEAGVGFSDGTFLKSLLLSQETEGFGPTGSWEIDANFFDHRLQIYGKAQVAFLLSTIEVNSGPFVTMTEETGGTSILLADANLSESREKSVWNTAFEVGLRYTFFRSLTVEVGYHRAGFLDAIILPSQIIVPEKEQTIPNGTSALYGTQDYRVEGWHAGLGFQF